jgi:hypothetical protein
MKQMRKYIYLLGRVKTRGDEEGIAMKWHVGLKVWIPNITACDSSITQNCFLQNQTQQYDKHTTITNFGTH